jgi:transposase
MTTPPAGISGASWLATSPSVRSLILSQQEEIRVLRQENEQMRQRLTALPAELASLRERSGRNARNSFTSPSSDGQGFKTRKSRKGSGRKRVGQPGHPGVGPQLLPAEGCDTDHESCPVVMLLTA